MTRLESLLSWITFTFVLNNYMIKYVFKLLSPPPSSLLLPLLHFFPWLATFLSSAMVRTTITVRASEKCQSKFFL